MATEQVLVFKLNQSQMSTLGMFLDRVNFNMKEKAALDDLLKALQAGTPEAPMETRTDVEYDPAT
jgi:hypothetical protein